MCPHGKGTMTLRQFQRRLARQLAALREQAGMTQAEVAVAAGFAKSAYQRLEWGKTNPTMCTLLAVANALNVSPGTLLDFL